jgi:hypothetical protein
MSNIIFNNLKTDLLDGSINLLVDDVWILLVREYNATSAINISASELSATVSFEYSGSSATALTETSGVNYTAGGYSLTGKYISSGNDVSYFTADNITISASTITCGGMIVYKKLTPLATSIPLGYFDFGVDRVSENGIFTIQWNSAGILTMEQKT